MFITLTTLRQCCVSRNMQNLIMLTMLSSSDLPASISVSIALNFNAYKFYQVMQSTMQFKLDYIQNLTWLVFKELNGLSVQSCRNIYSEIYLIMILSLQFEFQYIYINKNTCVINDIIVLSKRLCAQNNCINFN